WATPVEIVDKLNGEINAGLADPKIKARLTDLGGAPLVVSPAGFGRLIADETEKWAKAIKFVGIKAEGVGEARTFHECRSANASPMTAMGPSTSFPPSRRGRFSPKSEHSMPAFMRTRLVCRFR